MDVEASDYSAGMPMPPAPLPPMVPVVVEISRLKLQPGDILAMRFAGPVCYEQADALRRYLHGNVPAGVHTLLLDERMTLQVVDPSLRPVEVGTEEGTW